MMVILLIICTNDFSTLVGSTIIPLSGIAALSTIGIISASYMFGNVTRNDKLLEWSKTEAIQIFISIVAAVLILQLINGFCSISMIDISKFFGLPDAQGSNIFEGAQSYLVSAAYFTHQTLSVARYYVAAFNMLDLRSLWQCDFLCLFGSSGHSVNYEAGYSAFLPGLNISFNSAIFSFMSSLNYLFILLFIDSGLVLFFIPLGIILRSIPYMRPLGALLIAVALSFLIVYPVILASFSLIFKNLFTLPADIDTIKGSVNNEDNLDSGDVKAAGLFDLAIGGKGGYSALYLHKLFKDGKTNEVDVMKLAGAAFIAGVFLPTLAMLAAIGNVRFITRMLGEDIDLSRIVQMV